MIFVSGVCTVYICISEKDFLVIYYEHIKDNIYWYAKGKILSFLNRLLHEDLDPTPDITLTTLFCSLNTWCACVEFPQKIIPYWSMQSRPYAKYPDLKCELNSLWRSMQHSI